MIQTLWILKWGKGKCKYIIFVCLTVFVVLFGFKKKKKLLLCCFCFVFIMLVLFFLGFLGFFFFWGGGSEKCVLFKCFLLIFLYSDSVVRT